MRITHKLDKTVLTKNTNEDVNFLLTNKVGGYCLLSSAPSSRYQGVFFMDNSDMYKVIEDINLVGAAPVKEIVNEFSLVARKRGKFVESFFMPYGYDVLVYELDKPGEIEITLDIRKSYDNPEFGRIYKVSKFKSSIIVSYRHEKTSLYLVIKPDNLHYKIIGEWIKRVYDYDKKRNTVPFEKYVYKALRIKSQKIVFAFFKSKKQAIEEADYVFKNIERLKEHQKIYVTKINTKRPVDPRIRLAKKSAINSLNMLVANLKDKRGVFAGLPWFFQFWSRDELISLKAMMLNKQDKEVKDIIFKNLDLVKDGRLLNINMPEYDTTNADSIGWLFKRISDCLDKFSTKEKITIMDKLEDAIISINKNYLKDGLVFNKAKETWMDTEWGNDSREGFRIEIQALFLNMLKLAYEITKEKKYLHQENEFKSFVRKKFWNGRILADGIDDFTIRPNVFIAAYAYPELLSKTEWVLCFKNIIPKLWLKWGGFSTIEKNHDLFCEKHTGEIPQSYHRGDSWFWLNNLAALVLKRTDYKLFKKYVDKIVEASTEEILMLGAIGNHAELSSASGLKSQGCMAQAWSDAMYIELIEEF